MKLTTIVIAFNSHCIKGVDWGERLGQKVWCLVSWSPSSGMEPRKLYVRQKTNVIYRYIIDHSSSQKTTIYIQHMHKDSGQECLSVMLTSLRWDSQCIDRAKSTYVSNASNGKKPEPIRWLNLTMTIIQVVTLNPDLASRSVGPPLSSSGTASGMYSTLDFKFCYLYSFKWFLNFASSPFLFQLHFKKATHS